MRRQGPPLLQAYRDLAKLLRKESVIAESASWLFRSAPYLIFALTWVAAALVPSFASGLMFNWAADVGGAGRAAGRGPRPAGAGRHGCRHQLRRHRLVARDDDRHAGRAGHDADRADARHRRRHDAAGRRRRLLHRRAACRARVARAVADRAGHRGAGRECAHPGRQSGDASGAHHGPRGDGAGIFRTPPRPDRGGEPPQAGALPFAADLPVRAVRHGAGDGGPVRLGDRPRGLDRQAAGRRRAAGRVGGQHRQDARFPAARLRRHRLRCSASSPSCWRSSRAGCVA